MSKMDQSNDGVKDTATSSSSRGLENPHYSTFRFLKPENASSRGSPFEFNLIPYEDGRKWGETSDLYKLIYDAGGIVVTKNNAGAPYVMNIINENYFVHHPGENCDLPRDTYSSAFVFASVTRKRKNLPLPDPGKYLVGDSAFQPYNASDILHKRKKWSDLQLAAGFYRKTTAQEWIADLSSRHKELQNKNETASKQCENTLAKTSVGDPPRIGVAQASHSRTVAKASPLKTGIASQGKQVRDTQKKPENIPQRANQTEEVSPRECGSELKSVPAPAAQHQQTKISEASALESSALNSQTLSPEGSVVSDEEMEDPDFCPNTENIEQYSSDDSLYDGVPAPKSPSNIKDPNQQKRSVGRYELVEMKTKPRKNLKPMWARLYSVAEGQKLLDLICQHNGFEYTRGNKIWKLIEGSQVLGGRTFQSLRGHYLSVVEPKVLQGQTYKISPEDLAYLKKAKKDYKSKIHSNACPDFDFTDSKE